MNLPRLNPRVATIRYDEVHRMVHFTASNQSSQDWFMSPRVQDVINGSWLAISNGRIAHDPPEGMRALSAGVESPRSIATYLTQQLMMFFPEEVILITSEADHGSSITYTNLPRGYRR